MPAFLMLFFIFLVFSSYIFIFPNSYIFSCSIHLLISSWLYCLLIFCLRLYCLAASVCHIFIDAYFLHLLPICLCYYIILISSIFSIHPSRTHLLLFLYLLYPITSHFLFLSLFTNKTLLHSCFTVEMNSVSRSRKSILFL